LLFSLVPSGSRDGRRAIVALDARDPEAIPGEQLATAEKLGPPAVGVRLQALSAASSRQ
jgi:hypothetical protein